MEEPNYVLKVNEAAIVPRYPGKLISILKIALWILIVLLIVKNFFFKELPFPDMNETTEAILFVIAIITLIVVGKEDDVPSPMELQFYDTYLIVYRPKYYYSERVIRMEFERMSYDEISKCKYYTKLRRVHIIGKVHQKWYNFDKNGNMAQTPSRDRIIDDTIIFFRTKFEPGIDFVKEIETHSPIQVVLVK